jgi:hypothetical protein
MSHVRHTVPPPRTHDAATSFAAGYGHYSGRSVPSTCADAARALDGLQPLTAPLRGPGGRSQSLASVCARPRSSGFFYRREIAKGMFARIPRLPRIARIPRIAATSGLPAAVAKGLRRRFRPTAAGDTRDAKGSNAAGPVIRGHSVNSRSRPHSGHPGAREIVTPMTALKVVQT